MKGSDPRPKKGATRALSPKVREYQIMEGDQQETAQTTAVSSGGNEKQHEARGRAALERAAGDPLSRRTASASVRRDVMGDGRMDKEMSDESGGRGTELVCPEDYALSAQLSKELERNILSKSPSSSSLPHQVPPISAPRIQPHTRLLQLIGPHLNRNNCPVLPFTEGNSAIDDLSQDHPRVECLNVSPLGSATIVFVVTAVIFLLPVPLE
ncbi:hypothetical protein EDB86DRAFT_3243404 [Lactarius hatsudake]|nr:hypothetical protein EDB86DRAFT_3243404 [Lactarius hatsudake]